MERVPILRLGDLLVASIQIDMDDTTAMAFQDDLTTRIAALRTRGVVIDISAMDIVDSFIARMLATTGATASLLGAEVAVVGMRPAVAITLVDAGLTLEGVKTCMDLEAAVAMLSEDVALTERSADDADDDD